VLAPGGASFTVPTERVPEDAGSQVKVGVRPEKITISSDGGGGIPAGLNGVTGLLRMATYIGVSHQYKVDVAGETEMTVYVQNLGSEPALRPGDRVQLTWRPEHTFVVKPSAPLTAEEEEE
jgi:spermidine/putrescine transport system ATP-binding protein